MSPFTSLFLLAFSLRLAEFRQSTNLDDTLNYTTTASFSKNGTLRSGTQSYKSEDVQGKIEGKDLHSNSVTASFVDVYSTLKTGDTSSTLRTPAIVPTEERRQPESSSENYDFLGTTTVETSTIVTPKDNYQSANPYYTNSSTQSESRNPESKAETIQHFPTNSTLDLLNSSESYTTNKPETGLSSILSGKKEAFNFWGSTTEATAVTVPSEMKSSASEKQLSYLPATIGSNQNSKLPTRFESTISTTFSTETEMRSRFGGETTPNPLLTSYIPKSSTRTPGEYRPTPSVSDLILKSSITYHKMRTTTHRHEVSLNGDDQSSDNHFPREISVSTQSVTDTTSNASQFTTGTAGVTIQGTSNFPDLFKHSRKRNIESTLTPSDWSTTDLGAPIGSSSQITTEKRKNYGTYATLINKVSAPGKREPGKQSTSDSEDSDSRNKVFKNKTLPRIMATTILSSALGFACIMGLLQLKSQRSKNSNPQLEERRESINLALL